MWADEAIFSISIAKALNIREHLCLHAKLHGTSNNGGDNLTEEHWAMCDLHIVGKLEVFHEHNCLLHGNITPYFEQHHRNQAARAQEGGIDDQLCNDVQRKIQARSGRDHTQGESIHKC
jgi:hypothetical protein